MEINASWKAKRTFSIDDLPSRFGCIANRRKTALVDRQVSFLPASWPE
jgi:hypothetical protein